jgi:hypothetical protein
MLRDPDRPDLNWEDYEIEVQSNPDRPFYAPGETRAEKDIYARQRCGKIGRDADRYSDCTGSYYYVCVEKRRKKHDSL